MATSRVTAAARLKRQGVAFGLSLAMMAGVLSTSAVAVAADPVPSKSLGPDIPEGKPGAKASSVAPLRSSSDRSKDGAQPPMAGISRCGRVRSRGVYGMERTLSQWREQILNAQASAGETKEVLAREGGRSLVSPDPRDRDRTWSFSQPVRFPAMNCCGGGLVR